MQEDGKWVRLDNSWQDNRVVRGDVHHFSPHGVTRYLDQELCKEGSGGLDGASTVYDEALDELVPAEGCEFRFKKCSTMDEFSIRCIKVQGRDAECDCLVMPEDLGPATSFVGGDGCFTGPSQAAINGAIAQCGWKMVHRYDSFSVGWWP